MRYQRSIRNDLQFKLQKRSKRKKKSTISFWVLMGIIFSTLVVFVFPQFHLEKMINDHGIWWFDILQHILFFFFFSLILFKLLPFQKLTISFFLFIFLFSAFFEVLQKLLYDIHFSYSDTASNFVGIALAFVVFKYVGYWKIKPRRKKPVQRFKSMPPENVDNADEQD